MTIIELLIKHNVPLSKGALCAMKEYAAQEKRPLFNKLIKANILLKQYDASVPRDTRGGGNYNAPFPKRKLPEECWPLKRWQKICTQYLTKIQIWKKYLNRQYQAVHQMCASEFLSTPEKYGLTHIDPNESHDSELYISMLQGSEQNLRRENDRLRSALETIIQLGDDAWGDDVDNLYVNSVSLAKEALKGESK